MDSTIPKSQVILSYQEFFGEAPPENSLDLIKDLCKTTILGEFAALNYFLKPKTTMYYDTTLKTQWKLLFQFSGCIEELFNVYATRYRFFITNDNDYPILFSREGCLFAFEQIIHSDMSEIQGFTMKHSWPNIFRYIMAVNTEITRRTNYQNGEVRNLEQLNIQMLPLNELSINVNPLYTPYRGYRLMEFLSDHPQIGDYFNNYFDSTYHVPFGKFICEILSMYYANNKNGENDIVNPVTGEKLDVSFFYSVKPVDQALFLSLSGIFPNDKVERLISIKKYPFYNAGQNQFLLLDSVLLMDKAYGQFINDFWFDCVKAVKNEAGKPFGIRNYRSLIGLFLENYANKILRFCFKNNNNQVLKTFDELIIKTGKQQVELTDVYLRYKKQIFIAEVKSTGFYDEEKYSGDINQMYRNNRAAFFDSFGVDQIVNSIVNLCSSIKSVDPNFPMGKRCHVFPAIIVNEKAMQTPLMADVFNARFIELMKDVHTGNLVVYPLSLIHISDLEHIEDHMSRQPQEIWNLLRYHLRFPKFIPPFYNSIIRKGIKISFTHVKELFGELILKYQHLKK